MADFCEACGRDKVFSSDKAKRKAARYREHGPERHAQRIIDAVTRVGVQGATILEIGGGIGDVHLELLKRGAKHALNLEISPAYETEAQQLLLESGLRDRVERRMVDIARTPDAAEPADIVVLHRVVCCYPDYEALLGAAAELAGRYLIFSYRPRNPYWQTAIGLENLRYRLSDNEFRVFVHQPRAMLAVIAEHGLRPSATGHGLAWHVVTAKR